MKISKRWIPAVVAPSVIAATAIAFPLQANAVDLPDLSPAQVMTLMDGEITGFSGTVVKSTDLGLPPLELSSMMDESTIEEMKEKMPEGFEDFVPNLIEQNALTQAVELISGSHTFRIYASEVGMRVQVLDRMSQRDLIVNQDEFWFYDARNAIAMTGPIEFEVSDADKAAAEAELRTKLDAYAAELQLDLSNPDAVAEYLMAQAGESTDISVGKDHLIAGRAAYQLIAKPQSENSLIDSIVLSVDAETGMALDVKVFSREQEEVAVHVGFESISFETPNASLFEFEAPAGTTLQEVDVAGELGALEAQFEAEFEAMRGDLPTEAELEELKAELQAEYEAKYADQPKPEMVGDDWDAVVYVPAGMELEAMGTEVGTELPAELLENEIFSDLFEEVAGGRVFSTPILNVLLTDSGEIYAGAVSIEYLLEVAAR